MKSVMISIQPRWCELIASGKKTVEVRKRKPKIETPFKCYVYMTAGNAVYPVTINGAPYTCSNVGGKCVIGEFVCDRISPIAMPGYALVDVIDCKESCLTPKEMLGYADGKPLYGWHISNLVIYGQPKELSEFFVYCGENPKCEGCEAHYYSNTESGKEDYCCSVVDGHRPLKIPPQSWCYVVEKEGAE